MINKSLKDEILTYVKIIKSKSSTIQEVYEAVQTMNSLATISNLSSLETLLEGLIKVITGLIQGRLQFQEKHRELLLVSAEYIKRSLEIDKDLSVKYILSTFDDLASEQPSDINKSYINDIVRDFFNNNEIESSIKLDKSKEVAISLGKIDKMITSINDLILNQYQLKTTIEKLYDIELLDRARHRVNEINSQIRSQLLEVERSSTLLQENIISLRMLPLSIIYKEIKESINSELETISKKIDVIFPENDFLVDQLILQNLQNPLIYIVKNAIEHGISKNGKITISAVLDSDDVKITVEDSGNGINFKAIRAKCYALFPHEKDKISIESDKELLPYLYMEGVTSSNQEKHKGLGLSKALDEVKRVKGSIDLEAEDNRGLKVVIKVPRTLTTITGYFVKSAGEKLFIPTAYIVEIISINSSDVLNLVTKKAVKLRSELVALYPLSGILDDRDSNSSEKLSVIICRSDMDKIGIVVDEILYNASAIYKRLPHNIEMIEEIQGIAFDEEFKLINILYIPKIIEKLKKIRNIEFNTRYSKDNIKYKKILVVDDSYINRDIERNMLVQKGFSVDVASDGIEALQKTKDNFYHMIITDSSMPRMDGLTLIENIRKDRDYKEIPVIVFTSSEKNEDLSRLKELGVNSIYEKSNFLRDDLLTEVTQLLGDKLG